MLSVELSNQKVRAGRLTLFKLSNGFVGTRKFVRKQLRKLGVKTIEISFNGCQRVINAKDF